MSGLCAAHTNITEYAFRPRIFRSPQAVPIWKDRNAADLLTSPETHPESYLAEIAEAGYDAVWLNCVFRDAVPSALFPQVARKPLQALARTVARAKRFGVRVFLVLHEPRGFAADDPFWRRHPGLRGHTSTFPESATRQTALCSSTPAVQAYLEESSYNLFHCIPELGGVILLTASECQMHCYSHSPIPQQTFSDPNIEAWSKEPFTCPRCRARTHVAVTAELIRLIHRGVKRAAPQAEVVAHTWSWHILEPDPQPALISLLPKDVLLLSDWERGGSKQVGGKRYPVDEYSFSYAGPSPRFRQQLSVAKANRLRMLAKIQTNVTHELAAIPHLPVAYTVAKTMCRLRRDGVDGYLASIPFGAHLTPMSRLAGLMAGNPARSPAAAVRDLARREFGRKAANLVCRAWRKFSLAWRAYPFSIPFLYYGPMNYATAWPLSLRDKPRGCIESWLPLPRDADGRLCVGDNLSTWLAPFGAPTLTTALRAVLRGWDDGLRNLSAAVAAEPDHAALRKEFGIACHVALCLRSTLNIIRFYFTLRRKPLNAEQLRLILRHELELAKEDRDLVAQDDRLGYHPEAQVHLFTLEDLDYKIRSLTLCLAGKSEKTR